MRPLKAAKPATTSAMLARSQVTVMRGSSARVTMAALPTRISGFRARAGTATGATSGTRLASATATSAAGATASSLDDQAWKPSAELKLTRMAPEDRSML